MNSKRKLRLESLEGRHLLANQTLVGAGFTGEATNAEHRFQSTTAAQRLDSSAIFVAAEQGPADLIHEADDRVVVVDSSHRSGFSSRLWVFERQADGTLGTARNVIDPGFHVDRLLVAGDHAFVFGTQWTWDQGRPAAPAGSTDQAQTLVATIDLQQAATANHQVVQQTVPGLLKDLHQEGQQLVMVMHSSPPPIENFAASGMQETVHAFALTAAGLQEFASQRIDPGTTRVQGGRLLQMTLRDDVVDPLSAADANDPAQHNWVTQYAIRSDSIDPVAQVDLGSGWIGNFEIAETKTATAVRTDQSDGAAIVTAVDILDLSNDSIRLFDSLTVANFAGYAIAAERDFILLYDQTTPGCLLLVDTRTASGTSSERVRRIAIDPELTLHPSGLRLSNHRVVVAATRAGAGDPIDQLRRIASESDQSDTALLLTVSLDEARVVASSELGDVQLLPQRPQLHLIDASCDRLGLLVQANRESLNEPGFLFGQLDARGHFVTEGIVDAVRTEDEIDIDPHRLLIRSDGQLVQHRWDHPSQPALHISLDAPNRSPT